MCQAFSCIIEPSGKVTWKLGVDSHSELAKLAGLPDKVLGEFTKIEITPRNRSYLTPDEWLFRVDQSPVPSWYDPLHDKEKCWFSHRQWLKQLDKLLIRKAVVNPLTLPSEPLSEAIPLLMEWASVGDSVGASVRDSVRASVGDSVRASVWASVGDSVRASVWDSVWDSVRASVRASVRDSVRDSVRASVWASVWASVEGYAGSFFRLPQWRKKYPYHSVVALYNLGMVPSFDGKLWRLHQGPQAKIVFSATPSELAQSGKTTL